MGYKNNNDNDDVGIPVSKEPQGLIRSDGKRPDCLSLVPWEAGKPLTWDVTVICPLADSKVASAGGKLAQQQRGTLLLSLQNM